MSLVDEPARSRELAWRIFGATPLSGSEVQLSSDDPGFDTLLSDLSLDQATFYSRYSATQSALVDRAIGLLDDSAAAGLVRDAGLSIFALFGRSIEISSRYG